MIVGCSHKSLLVTYLGLLLTICKLWKFNFNLPSRLSNQSLVHHHCILYKFLKFKLPSWLSNTLLGYSEDQCWQKQNGVPGLLKLGFPDALIDCQAVVDPTGKNLILGGPIRFKKFMSRKINTNSLNWSVDSMISHDILALISFMSISFSIF